MRSPTTQAYTLCITHCARCGFVRLFASFLLSSGDRPSGAAVKIQRNAKNKIQTEQIFNRQNSVKL